MSNQAISIATLAPPLPDPAAPQGPRLPPAPAELANGATGLGPLPGPSIGVSTLPHRYLMAGIIPLAAAVVITLLGLIISWPGT